MGGLIDPPEPGDDFGRRIRVLIARQNLEELSRKLLCRSEGTDPADRDHGDVGARLLLLTADVPAEDWKDAYLLTRRAWAAYKGTSEVLHSRRAFGDMPEVLVREWEDAVNELRRAINGELDDRKTG
jgi:hypothetical protein